MDLPAVPLGCLDRDVAFACVEFMIAADQTALKLHEAGILKDHDLLIYLALRPGIELSQAEISAIFGMSEAWANARVKHVRHVLALHGFPEHLSEPAVEALEV